MSHVPSKDEGGLSPITNPVEYERAVSELYELLRTSDAPDLLEYVDRLSLEKGYSGGAEVFSYMYTPPAAGLG